MKTSVFNDGGKRTFDETYSLEVHEAKAIRPSSLRVRPEALIPEGCRVFDSRYHISYVMGDKESLKAGLDALDSFVGTLLEDDAEHGEKDAGGEKPAAEVEP
jgi:hypothetical protein